MERGGYRYEKEDKDYMDTYIQQLHSEKRQLLTQCKIPSGFEKLFKFNPKQFDQNLRTQTEKYLKIGKKNSEAAKIYRQYKTGTINHDRAVERYDREDKER